MNNGDSVKFVHISESDYNNISEKDDSTVYFIISSLEKRIAVGDVMYANYIPAHCTSVTLNKSQLELGVGEQYSFVAYTEPANPSDPIVFTTNNNNISITSGSSSNVAIVTADAIGSSILTVTCGNMTATCNITIHRAYVYTEHVLCSNYSPDGAKFKYTAPISLTDGQYIEVAVELSGITGTKENIISIGENIDVWNGANVGSHIMMYVTASNKYKISYDLILNSTMRRPTYTANTTTITMRFDQNGMWINGDPFLFDTDLRASATLNYETGMAAFLALNSYDIGSQEGANRSHALYYSIKYFTTE